MVRALDEFAAVAGADAELVDMAVAYQFPRAAHDRRVRERLTQIILPEVSVRVEMDDVQIRIFRCYCLNSAQRDQMLAAQHDGQFAVSQDLRSQALSGILRNPPCSW